MYVCMYACMYVCIYVCVCMCAYVCMCVCVFVCACVRVWRLLLYSGGPTSVADGTALKSVPPTDLVELALSQFRQGTWRN